MADFPTELRELPEQRLQEPFSMSTPQDTETYLQDVFPIFQNMQQEIYRLNKVVDFLMDNKVNKSTSSE